MRNAFSIFRKLYLQSFYSLIMIILGSCEDKQKTINFENDLNKEDIKKPFTILILGDSLTEGYGLNENEAYPSLLEKKLNENFSPQTKTAYKIINGGISGSTSSGGLSRIGWFLKSKPDLLILALGGNDGLRGIPIIEIKKNLSKIISTAQKRNLSVLLAGMKIPPNYGQEYTSEFSDLFVEISEDFQIPLIPFMLEGVGGNPELNLPDRIHPNAKGHQMICDIVYQKLIEILNLK